MHVACVLDVRKRVSTDDEEITQLPRLDGAEFVGNTHGSRAIDRRNLQCGGGRNADLYQRVQLTMRGEAGEELTSARIVGAEREHAAAIVERFRGASHR